MQLWLDRAELEEMYGNVPVNFDHIADTDETWCVRKQNSGIVFTVPYELQGDQLSLSICHLPLAHTVLPTK